MWLIIAVLGCFAEVRSLDLGSSAAIAVIHPSDRPIHSQNCPIWILLAPSPLHQRDRMSALLPCDRFSNWPMTAVPSHPLETPAPHQPEPQNWLRNPFVIALLLSLGAHVIFLALFPYFSSSAPSTPRREPVKTRALTMDEVSRLPESLRSSAANPATPLTTPPATPFSGLPDLSALMSPMPLPAPPAPLVFPDLTLPTPLTLDPPAQLPPLLPPPPVAQQPSSDSPAPESEAEQAAETPPAATTPTTSAPSASTDPEVAAVDESLYAFNPEGTDTSLGFGKLGDFVATLKTDYPDLRIPNQAIAVKLPLPEGDRCFEQVQPAQIAVLVGPNGKVLEDPQVLVSSGYPILNQLAIAALEKQPFPLRSRTELKLVNLEFVQPESSSCPVSTEATG